MWRHFGGDAKAGCRSEGRQTHLGARFPEACRIQDTGLAAACIQGHQEK